MFENVENVEFRITPAMDIDPTISEPLYRVSVSVLELETMVRQLGIAVEGNNESDSEEVDDD